MLVICDECWILVFFGIMIYERSICDGVVWIFSEGGIYCGYWCGGGCGV